MDSRQQQPQQRELVFCHQCENEWYRDEHGIICPECHGDFTEIIEGDHDTHEDYGTSAFPSSRAPDPDEGDIDDLQWHPNGPGLPEGGRYTGTFTRNINLDQNYHQGGYGVEQGAGGIFGTLAPVLQHLFGGGERHTTPHGEADAGQQAGPNGDRAGSPPTQHQHQEGNGRTFTRHASGPGYSLTITTSSNHNLFTRDANGPQAFQVQPDHIEHMMAQILGNIGAVPGHGSGPGEFRSGSMFAEFGGPIPMTGHGGGLSPIPIGNFFQLLGIAQGGVHGDAVYSQEALDRIITQLMDQHRSGNAPGPASAEAIESLPKRKIAQKDLDDQGKADCSICMDEAEFGSLVTELPCGHWFHHDCIKAWLDEHDTCPHCRQGIMPKDQPDADRARQPTQSPHNDMNSPEYQSARSPEYPFPRQSPPGRHGSAESSRHEGSIAAGLFGRMRQAFSPGSSYQQGGSNSDSNNNERNTPGG